MCFFFDRHREGRKSLVKAGRDKVIWKKGTDITEHQHNIISYDFHFKDVAGKVDR